MLTQLYNLIVQQNLIFSLEIVCGVVVYHIEIDKESTDDSPNIILD